MNEPKRRLSVDEIHDILDDIARNGEGADRIRALKMLREEQADAVTLPPPATVEEGIDMFVPLMQAFGSSNVQWAYRKAFPHNKGIAVSPPKIGVEDLDVFTRGNLPTTIRQFNKQFPECKIKGTPTGWPAGGGVEAKQEFIRNMALGVLRARKQAEIRDISPEAKAPPEAGHGLE